MFKKSEILDLIKSNQSQIFRYGVSRLGIFGSYQKNEQRDASDIDFLVEFLPGKKTFRNFMGLSNLLEEYFKIKIELITPESLSPFMKNKILSSVEYVLSTN